jgi:hypothetical protein
MPVTVIAGTFDTFEVVNLANFRTAYLAEGLGAVKNYNGELAAYTLP